MKISKELYDSLLLLRKRYLNIRGSYNDMLAKHKITREQYFDKIDADKKWYNSYIRRRIRAASI